jgi:hypothetical protein
MIAHVQNRDERRSLLVKDLRGDGGGKPRPRDHRADDIGDRLALPLVGVLEGAGREGVQGNFMAVVLDCLEGGSGDPRVDQDRHGEILGHHTESRAGQMLEVLRAMCGNAATPSLVEQYFAPGRFAGRTFIDLTPNDPYWIGELICWR